MYIILLKHYLFKVECWQNTVTAVTSVWRPQSLNRVLSVITSPPDFFSWHVLTDHLTSYEKTISCLPDTERRRYAVFSRITRQMALCLPMYHPRP